MQPNQARKNAARRLQDETGCGYQEAIRQLREDHAEHRERVGRPVVVENPVQANDPVPDVLPQLVRCHVESIAKYFHGAVNHEYYNIGYADWARVTLYRLTDALARMNLMVGTIAAHMRENGLSEHCILRYLQVSSHEEAAMFMTPEARAHLDGLMLRPLALDTDDLDVMWNSGRNIAEHGGASNGRGDTLEAFLAALYANYPDDPRAFDDLPDHVRECAIKAAEISMVPAVDPGT